MKIIIAFLVALLIFLVLRAIRLLLKRLSFRYAGLDIPGNIIVAVEFIVWLLFIFWASDYLLGKKDYYPYLVYALILIITGFLAWFLLRDIFAGIIFRVKYNLKTGTHIRAGEVSGNIKSQHLTFLKIRTEDGWMLRIPYSKINDEVITELAQTNARDEHILHLQVESSLSKPQAETLIRSTIMNTPWSNVKAEPSIKFLKENEEEYLVEVVLFSVSTNHVKFIEMALKEVPSIKMPN